MSKSHRTSTSTPTRPSEHVSQSHSPRSARRACQLNLQAGALQEFRGSISLPGAAEFVDVRQPDCVAWIGTRRSAASPPMRAGTVVECWSSAASWREIPFPYLLLERGSHERVAPWRLGLHVHLGLLEPPRRRVGVLRTPPSAVQLRRSAPPPPSPPPSPPHPPSHTVYGVWSYPTLYATVQPSSCAYAGCGGRRMRANV